jgi:hypothetical protein
MLIQTTPYLISEKNDSILNCVIQYWQLTKDFKIYLQIHDNGFASVYLLPPNKESDFMFEAEKIVPLFNGLDIEIQPCIDGKAFKVRASVLTSFIDRFDQIIEKRLKNARL